MFVFVRLILVPEFAKNNLLFQHNLQKSIKTGRVTEHSIPEERMSRHYLIDI
jgi:hypothetical protein